MLHKILHTDIFSVILKTEYDLCDYICTAFDDRVITACLELSDNFTDLDDVVKIDQ